ncbi:MAG: hypothetical protein V1794_19295 [Candidatus Glassbacteria bacterium]
MRAGSLKILLLAVAVVPALAAAPADSSAADTSRAAVRPDSGLGRHDSTMMLGERYSGENYLARRERFSYPRTNRSDPFDFPMGEEALKTLGPALNDLQLTGILYTPDGPRIAILLTTSGESFLLHEGDRLGTAELSLIEPSIITFVIREYGLVREFVIELKPLAEGTNGSESSNAGNGGRQEETGRAADESGGPAPKKQP